MSTKDFTANVISATKVVPDGNFKDSKASGIWDINEALDLIKGGNWPNVANINPAAFVDGLFQTHLYDGTSGNLSIDNDINLSGSGGLVWFKDRNYGNNHRLYDTARGVRKYLDSSANATEATNSGSGNSNGISAFNSNGFTIGNDGYINDSSSRYVSWTFRKQPKFFDVVTYAGNGTSGREITHNLGTTVGAIFVKSLNNTRKWSVFHRGMDASNPSHYKLHLDQTDARADEQHIWNDTEPTSSVFTVGSDGEVNANGENYVAYLFAHNDDDGGFGEPGDQDIIKCGTYDTDGNGDATVNLGFEPQFVFVKCSTAASNWYLLDTMRGMSNDNPVENARLYADTSGAESSTGGTSGIVPTSTGFFHDGYIAASQTFIYMAIRRGSMQTPTAASDVFAIDTFGSTGDSKTPGWRSGFPVDMAIYRITSGNNDGKIASRLTAPKYLRTNSTAAESTDNDFTFDYNNGWYNYTGTIATYVSYMWARARGYFDVVATKAVSTNNGDVNHSLGVKPEMAWYKRRDGADEWYVATAINGYLVLDKSNAANGTASGSWLDAVGGAIGGNDATATTINSGYKFVGNATYDMIIYLFATVANVSKVGSFTQSGATNVACGFTGNTPSLVILKRTDASGDWYLLRDIVAGNDKSFYFNTNALEITNADIVDPYSGGFATTSSLTDGDYIFYAIAAIS